MTGTLIRDIPRPAHIALIAMTFRGRETLAAEEHARTKSVRIQAITLLTLAGGGWWVPGRR